MCILFYRFYLNLYIRNGLMFNEKLVYLKGYVGFLLYMYKKNFIYFRGDINLC